MTEDPTVYQPQKPTHADFVDLTPSVTLVAFMLASRKLASFTNNNPVVSASSLLIESLAYMNQYSPDEISRFYQQVSKVLQRGVH